jgi:GNAT superfamily N-acetyltransferase
MTAFDEKKIISSGGAYFVHRDGQTLGIGWMEENKLLALVSMVPGMGQRVAEALFTTVDADSILLEVVSTNERAIRLYERMGFVKTGEVSRWYCVR